MKELKNFIEELKKGSYMQVITCTEPKMRKTNNPYIGRVEKITLYYGVRTGVDYANCINNAMQRVGIDDTQFIADAPRGMQWAAYPFILKSIKDESQLYLRISIDKSSKSVSYWNVDGRLATDAEVAVIKNFLPAVSGSAKQAQAGLENEDQIQVRSIKFENIVYIKQGEREYRDEDSLSRIYKADVALAK